MGAAIQLPRLPIQITQLAISGFDFAGIDFRVMCKDILPPLLLVELFKVHEDSLVILFPLDE